MTAPPSPGVPYSGNAVPACYRHPDRETYIQCVRCGKSICPSCMHEASVGFQCPDCVRAGNQAMRPATNSLGNKRSTGDPVLLTKVLIGINVVVFVATYLSGRLGSGLAGSGRLLNELVLIPHDPDQLYRLVTSGFVHLGLLHIGLNMYVLWTMGQQLEPALGRGRYLALYGVSLIGGSAAAFTFSNNPSAGASGAVFGLFAALFVIGRRLRLDVRGVAVLIGINLVISFLFASAISWQAHIGGLITGAVLAVAFAYAPRGPARLPIQIAGAALMLAVSVAVIVIGTQVSLAP